MQRSKLLKKVLDRLRKHPVHRPCIQVRTVCAMHTRDTRFLRVSSSHCRVKDSEGRSRRTFLRKWNTECISRRDRHCNSGPFCMRMHLQSSWIAIPSKTNFSIDFTLDKVKDRFLKMFTTDNISDYCVNCSIYWFIRHGSCNHSIFLVEHKKMHRK